MAGGPLPEPAHPFLGRGRAVKGGRRVSMGLGQHLQPHAFAAEPRRLPRDLLPRALDDDGLIHHSLRHALPPGADYTQCVEDRQTGISLRSYSRGFRPNWPCYPPRWRDPLYRAAHVEDPAARLGEVPRTAFASGVLVQELQERLQVAPRDDPAI